MARRTEGEASVSPNRQDSPDDSATAARIHLQSVGGGKGLSHGTS